MVQLAQLLSAFADWVVLADAEGWDHMNGWGWGWMLGAWMLIVLVALAAAAVAWMGRPDRRYEPRRATPRELLDERYARGEIDEEEYERRKLTLGT